MIPQYVEEKPASILIVTADSPFDQWVLSFLQEEGFQVHLAEVGSEAIRKAQDNHYDLILVDSHGHEAEPTFTIQSLTQFPSHLPVILTVTSQIGPQQRVEFLKNGAFDLLTKPYQSHEIKVIFQRALVVTRWKGTAAHISQKLKTSEEHFKSVVQASPDAIILGDEWGNILSWNGAAQTMFGYTAEEVIGQSLTLLMPSRYHQAHEEGLRRVRASQHTKVIGRTVELVGLRKGGREFPIELSLSYSFVENKIFYCGIIRDITARKKAEEALEESENRFQLTLENIHDAVFYGDLSGRILWANTQASNLVGRPMQELLGHSLMECFSHEAAQKAEFRLALVRQGVMVSPQAEFEIIRPDGSSRWIEASSTNVMQKEKVVGRLLVGRDITKRKEAEFALVERNRMLALDAELCQIISRTPDLPSLLQACSETLLLHLKAAFVRMWTLEKGEHVLTLRASAGLYTHLDGPHSRIPVGQLKVGQIAAEKKPIMTNSVVGDPRIPDQEWAKRQKLVAFAGYPLLRNQEVMGVMAVFSKHPLTDYTLKSLGLVADRITTAIDCHMATIAHQNLTRLHEQILASAGEGIFGIDHQGRITFSNPASATMLGYPHEEMQGLQIQTTVHPENDDGSSCAKEKCSVLSVLEDGVSRHEDREVFCRKNGTTFPVEYTKTPMLEDGRVVGTVVTFKDISERKLAEEAHERIYQQLALTLASLPGSILVVDTHQKVVYANAEAQQHFEPNHATLVGRDIHHVLPFTSGQWKKLVEKFSHREDADMTEHLNQEFAINDRIYSYSLFPISLDGKAIVQTGIVAWDMTEKTKLQQQIIQSEKLSSLGTLVSGMVHEVRSPMQSIVGYADLISEETHPEKIKEFARDLKRVSQHITTVLTEFMTYARPSLNEEPLAVNLNDRLDEAVKMVRRGPHFGKVEVDQQFSPIPPVSIRQGEIDQVFINLIGNAVQAMGGKGRLIVSTTHQDHVVITQIADTGCGMPKDILTQIFDPFFSTKGKGKGTGLGLSIVHQIVKRGGGQISVDSTVGKGTTFTIKLPAHHTP